MGDQVTYPITAVQDRLVLDLVELKALLGITEATLDTLLTLALDVAKEDADDWMQNPFLQRVNLDWQDYRRNDRVGQRRFDDLTVNYTYRNDPEGLQPDRYVGTGPAHQLPIPSKVKLGVVEYVRAYLAFQTRHAGVMEESTREVRRKYTTLEDALDDIRQSYWDTHSLTVGF